MATSPLDCVTFIPRPFVFCVSNVQRHTHILIKRDCFLIAANASTNTLRNGSLMKSFPHPRQILDRTLGRKNSTVLLGTLCTQFPVRFSVEQPALDFSTVLGSSCIEATHVCTLTRKENTRRKAVQNYTKSRLALACSSCSPLSIRWYHKRRCSRNHAYTYYSSPIFIFPISSKKFDHFLIA